MRLRRAVVHVVNLYFVGIGIGALRRDITQLLTTRYAGTNAIRQRGVSQSISGIETRRIGR